jgi:MFS family permease
MQRVAEDTALGPGDGPWATLRHPTFRSLWLCGGAYFIANAMHAMVVAWLVLELTASSFLAAIVQTAVFLPMFLLSLPAGVLADTTDRKRLILTSLGVQAVAVSLLGTMLFLGAAGATSLLLLTFIAGSCTAVFTPAWSSMFSEILPRQQLSQAITTMSIAYNTARALGPTLAGLLYAGLQTWAQSSLAPPAGAPLTPGGVDLRVVSLSGAGVLAVSLCGTALLAWAINRWPPAPHPVDRLPAERLWGGTLAGVRYAKHSHVMLSQLVRAAAYGSTASAMWALLPAISSQRLGSGASDFGLLMGCLGCGAVAAAFFIGRMRSDLGLERLVRVGIVVFASALAVAALSPTIWPIYLALALCGAAWMAVMSTYNTATQSSAPPWVRSRASALHVLAAMGSFALGSMVWGALAGIAGLQAALLTAAVAMLAGIWLARPFPLRMGEELEVTPAPHESLLVTDEPSPDAGPVAVELIYRVLPHAVGRFLEQAVQLKASRQRDGASFWRLYRDLGGGSRYVERFIVQNWVGYLRQRNRKTVADMQVEVAIRDCLGGDVETRHYLAER